MEALPWITKSIFVFLPRKLTILELDGLEGRCVGGLEGGGGVCVRTLGFGYFQKYERGSLKYWKSLYMSFFCSYHCMQGRTAQSVEDVKLLRSIS